VHAEVAAVAAAASNGAGPLEVAVQDQSQVIDAGDKMIIVDPSGTIIIGGPEAVARAQASEVQAPETAEAEYLTGARRPNCYEGCGAADAR
jgi:hypothetical protein